MLISKIVANVNTLLAGERHSYLQLIPYLDKTIDYINSNLGSTYPAFSELPDGASSYDFFPDRYIRTVVQVGAAWHYFTTDEEGITTAQQYQYEYEQNMFLMERDFIMLVPAEYKAPTIASLVMENDLVTGERGVYVDGWNLIP